MHSNLTPGAPVYTSDSQHIGAVKEVRGARFKVDTPMKPDFWLAVTPSLARARDA